MVEIVGVRFKKVGKIYYFDPCGLKFKTEDNVIVETVRGIEFGTVVMENRMVDDDNLTSSLKPVLRKATAADKKKLAENQEKQKNAYFICLEKIKKHGLKMKLIDVEYTFDCGKVLFYFTADGRVDFRDLVKDLASVFKTRIELRQIGVRDEAKLLGGIGICGRPLCCNSFLGEFIPVSIKMAKEQGLSLNPTKISGTCGRLMCCLKYEQDTYEELGAKMPNTGAVVDTPEGQGVVTGVETLKSTVTVRLENVQVPKEFPLSKISVLKNGSGHDTKIPAELKKLEDH